MQAIKKHTKTGKPNNYPKKKDKSMLFLTLAVLGLFLGLLLIIALFSITIISFYTILKFLVGFAIVGFLIPLKYYQKWFQFIKYEMIIFNVIGVAPFMTGLILLVNFLIISESRTELHNIEKAYFDSGRFVGIVLENNAYADESRIVEFSDKSLIEIRRYKSLQITLNKGLFGFEVVESREFLY